MEDAHLYEEWLEQGALTEGVLPESALFGLYLTGITWRWLG
jgi:hypothetical protein